MIRPQTWSKQSPLQSILLIGLALFFLGQALLLSPSNLEEDFGGMRIIHPKDLISLLKNEPGEIFRAGLPVETAPSYSLRDHVLYSSQEKEPNLKLTARKTSIYQQDQVAHSREVVALLRDGTIVDAEESVYFMSEDRINLYGKVHATFVNGTEVFTEFATLYTKPVPRIEVPTSEWVRGFKKEKHSVVNFESYGMNYVDLAPKTLHLLDRTKVIVVGKDPSEVYSDEATFKQEEGLLHFYMHASRPISEQFVKVKQPDLDLKSRLLDLKLSKTKDPDQLIAREDVWFRDAHDPEKVSIGTGGLGVYEFEKNIITLSDYPQLYQDSDTITGDVIVFYRNTDIVEVKQSNAIYNSTPKAKETQSPRTY